MNQIGRYQVLGELGRGAMGIVYRAQDPAIGRIIAIKSIRLAELTDSFERERVRERLFREAQSAGILSHPNIVTIYDVAEGEGLAYIFMEYVNGPSLERLLLSRKPPDSAAFLSILRQTANALDYAHKKGIVHRDIKPANIMIDDAGQAKITDFGVAKILSHQMTQSGSMMGTPNYMSPEQVQGHAVDGKADQFALAVIAYEVLTGEKPFAGEYLPTLLYKIVREKPAPPQRINATLSNSVEGVMERALSKEPRERFGSCSAFVESLTLALNESPGWQPLARGVGHDMPTLGGAAVPLAASRKGKRAREAAIPAAGRIRGARPEGNPLLKSLVWVLVGIGLVGLALLGAQKFLFNQEPETHAKLNPVESPAPPPAEAEQPVDKPSPMGNAAELPADRTPEKAASNRGAASVPAAANDGAPGPTASEPSGPERTVQFLTEPPGASVVVDGDASHTCRTPCQLSLKQGRHTMDASLAGYRSYPKIFNVPQDSDLLVNLARTSGTLSITSNPPGATVQLNGEEQPQKTPAMFKLTPGTYRVRVTGNGAPLDFQVEVRDGEFKSRNVDFQ